MALPQSRPWWCKASSWIAACGLTLPNTTWRPRGSASLFKGNLVKINLDRVLKNRLPLAQGLGKPVGFAYVVRGAHPILAGSACLH